MCQKIPLIKPTLVHADILASVGYKICNSCKKELPATPKYFHKAKATKDGLQHTCKKCQYLRTAAYRLTEKGRKQQYGYSKTINGFLRRLFKNMKQRCYNPHAAGYEHYGGRGIEVCFKSSNEFVNYVINELQIDPRGLTIDRIDNDKNYERGNIRFITMSENSLYRWGKMS